MMSNRLLDDDSTPEGGKREHGEGNVGDVALRALLRLRLRLFHQGGRRPLHPNRSKTWAASVVVFQGTDGCFSVTANLNPEKDL